MQMAETVINWIYILWRIFVSAPENNSCRSWYTKVVEVDR